MTTEELLDSINVNAIYEIDKILYFSEESVKEIMIEFAKYHVEQALKEAVDLRTVTEVIVKNVKYIL